MTLLERGKEGVKVLLHANLGRLRLGRRPVCMSGQLSSTRLWKEGPAHEGVAGASTMGVTVLSEAS